MARAKRAKQEFVPFEQRSTAELATWLRSEKERQARLLASHKLGLGRGYLRAAEFMNAELEMVADIMKKRKA
jgi:hypothetical protein